jgi:methyl-accepting chemotaxis protein
MKIKTKILGVFGLFIVAELICVALYGIFALKIGNIHKEEKVLSEVRELLIDERTLLHSSSFEVYKDNRDSYTDFIDSSENITSLIESLKYLPNTNDSIKRALIAIKVIDDMTRQRRAVYFKTYDTYLSTLEKVSPSTNSRLDTVFLNKEIKDNESYVNFTYTWNSFYRETLSMLSSINSSLDMLNEQSDLITSEVDRIAHLGLIIVLVIIIPVFLAALFAIFKVLGNITAMIGNMKSNLSYFIEGDLTQRIESSSKDELGELSSDLDNYREGLNSSLTQIKNVSSNNMKTKDSLKNSVSLSHQSLDEVNESVSSIDSDTKELNESMGSVIGAMDSNFSLVNGLGEQIGNQHLMVEETSSAIQQIITSVDSIAQMSDTGRKGVEELVTNSREGIKKLDDIQSVMSLINGSGESLLGMVEIIENISSQTNLLSMNAAIEAAHAGEAGKGFSVVAEEIRKLADNASNSARQMSDEIRLIIANIVTAEDTSTATGHSFETISNEVDKVNRIFSEVHNAVEELKSGSGQIQNTATSLRDFSSQVEASSRDISGNTEKVLEEISQVKNIAHNVKEKSSRIVQNMEVINERMKSVESASHYIEKGSESIDSVLNRFKTEHISDMVV